MLLRALVFLLGLITVTATSLAQFSCETAVQSFCGSPNAVAINAGIGSDNNNYCGFANTGNEFYLSFSPSTTGE